APADENNTIAYTKFLYKATGVERDKKVKDFTPQEFEKFWKAIEKMEATKKGEIIEVFEITEVRKNKKGSLFSYCIEGDEWMSKKECIELAAQGRIDLEVCISRLGNTYLRKAPSSFFQKSL